MDDAATLSLAEWVVLAVVEEQPTHGFAVAALTASSGSLGRVWQVPRPVVYRALARIEQLGLVTAEAVEHGRGPQRTVFAATATGRAQVRSWLQTPVEHVRDVRSHLLLKLALLDRRGQSPARLVARQKAVIAPIVAAVSTTRDDVTGFDRTLVAWRRATASATAAFLDDID